jgi:hypothetical protein
VVVTFPAGSAAGTWVLSRLTLTNNAGLQTAENNPMAPTFTLTSNAVVSASGFAADPALVDNWRAAQRPTVRMKVAGAQNGVAKIFIDTEQHCTQQSTEPTTDASGTVAIALYMSEYTDTCRVNGIAVIDGRAI